MPMSFFAYISPILANWHIHSALASTLAPQSRSSEAPFAVGMTVARGVRRAPLIRPSFSWPPARMAPDEPADKKASASPFLTAMSPLTIEDSFLACMADTG